MPKYRYKLLSALSKEKQEAFHQLWRALYPKKGLPLDVSLVRESLQLGAPAEGIVMCDEPAIPLWRLISFHHEKASVLLVMDMLIRSGAQVSHRDKNGQTLLHIMAMKGWCAQGVRAVISAGLNPNTRDLKGRTPLHILAVPGENANRPRPFWRNRGEWIDHAVKTFVEAGVDVNAVDNRAYSPFDAVLEMSTRKTTSASPASLDVTGAALVGPALFNQGLLPTRHTRRFLHSLSHDKDKAFFDSSLSILLSRLSAVHLARCLDVEDESLLAMPKRSPRRL